MSKPSNADEEEQREVELILQLMDTKSSPTKERRTASLLQQDILKTDDDSFLNFFGLHRFQYRKLCHLLDAKIKRSHTKFENVGKLRPADRILILLRFLATGCTFKDLGLHYDLPADVVETIVYESSKAVNEYFGPVVLPQLNQNIWRSIILGFANIFSIPNCLGSISHTTVNVGPTKQDLLTLVDSGCRIIAIDLGKYGFDKNPDIAMNTSKLGQILEDNKLQSIPAPYEKANALPRMVIGGKNFPEKPYLLTPYNDPFYDIDKIFNCRIKPVEKVADQAMDRLLSRFKILQGTFSVPLAQVEGLIRTACCLYNHFCVPAFQPDKKVYYEVPKPVLSIFRAYMPEDSEDPRVIFHKYFISPKGTVQWQWEPLTFF